MLLLFNFADLHIHVKQLLIQITFQDHELTITVRLKYTKTSIQGTIYSMMVFR